MPLSSDRSSVMDYRLCFVDENVWAYFANVDPMEMSGDDWNDAPHDCNAGEPYPRDGQKVICVAYRGPWEMAGTQWNQHWPDLCAAAINRGKAPWLYDPGYGDTFPEVKARIDAGTTLADFIERVQHGHGTVFMPLFLPVVG